MRRGAPLRQVGGGGRGGGERGAYRGGLAGRGEPAAAGAGGRLSAVRRVVRAEDRGGYRVVGGRGAAWGCRYYGGCYYGGKRAGEWRIGWMERVGVVE